MPWGRGSRWQAHLVGYRCEIGSLWFEVEMQSQIIRTIGHEVLHVLCRGGGHPKPTKVGDQWVFDPNREGIFGWAKPSEEVQMTYQEWIPLKASHEPNRLSWDDIVFVRGTVSD